MTNKERKQLKHSLKTDIDRSETWILLALAGHMLEVPKHIHTAQTRETIVAELKQARQDISDKTEKYLAEIDDAIAKMS